MPTPPFTLPTAAQVRDEASLQPAQVDVSLPDDVAYLSYIDTVITDKARVVWRNIAKLSKPYVWPLTDALYAAAMEGETSDDVDTEQAEENSSATLATKYRAVAHLKNKAGYYSEAKSYDDNAAALEADIAEAIMFVVGRQEPQAPTTTYSSTPTRNDGYAASSNSTEYSC